MAPEVMCKQNHGVAVDYYGLGILTYECMFGRRPYVGKSRQEIRDSILSKQVQITKQDIPSGWSIEAADFININIKKTSKQTRCLWSLRSQSSSLIIKF